MEDEIIPIFLDSNCLFNTRLEKDIFNLRKTIGVIIRIRDFVKANTKKDGIEIIIPRVVVDERKNQVMNEISRLLTNINRNQEKIIEIYEEKIDLSSPYEELENQFEKKVKNDIESFILYNKIKYASYPSSENFGTIIDLALKKEIPFNSQGKGFKDALIWFSIQDYLIELQERLSECAQSDIDTPICKRAYFLTENTKDFLSQELKFKLKIETGVKIFLVLPDKSKNNLFDFKYPKFLSDIIKDIDIIKIESVTFFLEQYYDELHVYSIIADPFPSDISSFLITKKYSEENYKKYLKENIVKIFDTYNFVYDKENLKIYYKRTPAISQIIVELDYHRNGQYYDIASIEIEYWNDKIEELEPYHLILIPECISSYLDRWGDSAIEVLDPYKYDIVDYIEEELNRKIDPSLLEFREFY